MRLTDLEPQFVRYEKRPQLGKFLKPGIDPLRGNWTDDDFVEEMRDTEFYVFVDTIGEAQGIDFLCPKCYKANNGPVGTHRVICWSSSRGVPDDARPAPGRWQLIGTGYGDLTLEAEPGKSRSVQLIGGCSWHGFVTNGEVTDA